MVDMVQNQIRTKEGKSLVKLQPQKLMEIENQYSLLDLSDAQDTLESNAGVDSKFRGKDSMHYK